MESEPLGRGRGRPERSGDERARMRARIEACARDLFYREGYEAVSMRKIAAGLSCSTNTLYAYFDSKMDILAAVWADIFGQVFAELTPGVAAQETAAGRVQAFCEGYVRGWLVRPEEYRLVFMSGGVTQADVSAFLADERLAGAFEALLDGLAAHHGVTTEVPEVLRRRDYLLTAIHGVPHCLITMSGHPWPPADDLVRMAVDAALR